MNESNRIGRLNELVAVTKALAKKLIVCEPMTTEPFDFLIQSPTNPAQFLKCQCKTLYYRKDKASYVCFSKKNNNQRYTSDEVDVFLAIDGDNVYWIPHNGNQTEYWAKRPKEKWIML